MATAVINPGQFANALGQNYGFDNVLPPFYLNGASLIAAAAAFPALPIPAYNTLTIKIWVPSIGGADIPFLRFNADAGNNYVDRALTVAASPTVTLGEVNNTSTNALHLGASTATGRLIVVDIGNVLNQPKVAVASVIAAPATVATSMIMHVADGGVWFNTTQQITNVLCSTGGQLMGIGSSIQIFGGY